MSDIIRHEPTESAFFPLAFFGSYSSSESDSTRLSFFDFPPRDWRFGAGLMTSSSESVSTALRFISAGFLEEGGLDAGLGWGFGVTWRGSGVDSTEMAF